MFFAFICWLIWRFEVVSMASSSPFPMQQTLRPSLRASPREPVQRWSTDPSPVSLMTSTTGSCLRILEGTRWEHPVRYNAMFTIWPLSGNIAHVSVLLFKTCFPVLHKGHSIWWRTAVQDALWAAGSFTSDWWTTRCGSPRQWHLPGTLFTDQTTS